MSVPMLQKVKRERERMAQCGVIEEMKEPMERCTPMAAVPKKNGQMRIRVDLKQLNKAVKRESFPQLTTSFTDYHMPKFIHFYMQLVVFGSCH